MNCLGDRRFENRRFRRNLTTSQESVALLNDPAASANSRRSLRSQEVSEANEWGREEADTTDNPHATTAV